VLPGRAALAAMLAVGLLATAQAEQPATDDAALKTRLVSILGREVANRDGDGGRVIDVLVDLDGRSGAVVVEFGGFMGIGSRKVAVSWYALRFVREGNRSLLIVDVSRDQVRDAPEYKPNESPTVLTTQ
jgi:PRC-barrel domain